MATKDQIWLGTDLVTKLIFTVVGVLRVVQKNKNNYHGKGKNKNGLLGKRHKMLYCIKLSNMINDLPQYTFIVFSIACIDNLPFGFY